MIDIYFKNNFLCVGCGACASICPRGCIELICDPDGFFYPSINTENCIRCNACMKVCIALKEEIRGISDNQQEAVAAITKNHEVWKQSASGGAFSELCNSVYSLSERYGRKALFVGAVIKRNNVFHQCVDDIHDISKFRKSKYVQSDMGDCMKNVATALKDGDYVLFSGTPCQIAGLRHFLGKVYDNLFCIDVICHGVGSRKVFQKCIEDAERKFKQPVTNYNFRVKMPIFGSFNRHTSEYSLTSGKKKYIVFDDYNKLFLNQACINKSCGENCKFRKPDRQGDVTISDFNSKYLAFPELNDYRNYSTIIFNSEQGRKLKPYLLQSMDIYQCDIDHIKKYNPLFCKTTKDNPQRNDFFSDFRNGEPISELIKKYGLSVRMVDRFIDYIPYSMKRVFFKISKLF